MSLDRGDPIGAILDMTREIPKHPETAGGDALYMALAAKAMSRRSLQAARDYVEGYH